MLNLRGLHAVRVLAAVPLAFESEIEDRRIAVWRGDEPLEQLLEHLPLRWQQRLPRHPDRIVETLAARSALLHLLPEAIGSEVLKDGFGKPHLSAHPHVHFSLTHSHGCGGALVSTQPCGIDLQCRVDKILRLRSKFEREDEREVVAAHDDEVAALHVLWGAKESLFKLWGRRLIDWRQHLIVDAFDARHPTGTFTGRVVKPERTIEAQLTFQWIAGDCLVTASGLPSR